MGIPLFFKDLILSNFSGVQLDELRKVISTLIFDFAGLAHQIVHRLNIEHESWTREKYFRELEREILEIVSTIKPSNRLIISVDGIAPLGKINQQRKRRFRNAFEKLKDMAFEDEFEEKLPEGFDSNAISPGTEFSLELHKFLLSFIQKNRNLLPSEVYYSSFLSTGEGEHKIIKLIHEKCPDEPRENIAILGLDADLILLSLGILKNSAYRDIFIYRKNEYVDERASKNLQAKGLPKRKADQKSIRKTSDFVAVKILREELIRRDIGIDEFILSVSLLGNDFIPSQAGFNLIGEFDREFLSALESRTFANPFDLSSFQDFIKVLVPIQAVLFKKIQGIEPMRTRKYNLLHPTFIEDYDSWNRRLTFEDILVNDFSFDDEIDFSKQVLYYVKTYLATILWTVNYYTDHLSINWSWTYWSYWAPLLEDILKISPQEFEKFLESKEILTPRLSRITILGQLTLILPRNMETGEPNHLLPEALQVYQEKNSIFFDFYPLRFEIIRDGVLRDTDGFAYLPPIDYQRFITYFNELSVGMTKKKLSEFNEIGYYTFNREKLSTASLPASYELVEKIKLPRLSSQELFRRKVYQLFGEEYYNERRRIFPSLNSFDKKLTFKFTPVKIIIRKNN